MRLFLADLISRHMFLWRIIHQPYKLIRPGTKVRILLGQAAGMAMYFHNSPHYASGYWEYPLQEALARVLSRGQIYYDIGANIGLFTLVGARLVGPTGKVYAFEPVPRFIEQLRSNVQCNHLENTMVIPKAVSDCSSMAKLYLQSSSGSFGAVAAKHELG